MDPFSLSTGIAGLITLAFQVGEYIMVYAKTVKEKPNNVQELQDELLLLADVLRKLGEFLTSEKAKGHDFDEDSVLKNAIKNCTARMKRISDRLKPPEGGKLARAIDRLKWPYERKDIEQLVDSLRRFTHTFQFAVTTQGCTILSRSSDSAQEGLDKMLEKIDEMRDMCQKMEISASEWDERKAQINQIRSLLPALAQQAEDVRELVDTVKGIDERDLREEKTKILEWLMPRTTLYKHVDIQRKHAAGTCQWFLDHPQFRRWEDVRHPSDDLLCLGRPGAGKTVLSSVVFDHLREKYKGREIAVVYFYFNHLEEDIQTPIYFAKHILRQLCQSFARIPASVHDFFSKNKDEIEYGEWLSTLRDVLGRVTATFHHTFVVLDALDESRKQLHGIFKVLDAMRLSFSRVRVFATARPHLITIEDHFDNPPVVIQVEAAEEDIRRYLVHRIDQHPDASFLLDQPLREEVLTRLCAGANGIFLLPALQIDHTLGQVTKADVRRSLDELPSLEDVFRSTVQRIQGLSTPRRDLAFRTMMWISHARETLAVGAIQHALATRPVRSDTDDFDNENVSPLRLILDSCCGLVEWKKETSTLQLVHNLLEEYILREPNHGFFADGHLVVTRTCLKYMSYPSLRLLASRNRDNFRRSLTEWPLLEYASTHWGHHARLAAARDYVDLALPLFNSSLNMLTVARVRDLQSSPRQWTKRTTIWADSSGAGVSLSAFFGLDDLIRLMFEQTHKPDLKAENAHGSTALHEAAMLGHGSTCELLIEHDANVMAVNKGKSTPFYLAVSYDHVETARTLLKYNKAQLEVACHNGFTALHKAANLGLEDAVIFLLSSGASCSVQDKGGMTPLHLAARKGRLGIARLLVMAGSTVNDVGSDGQTPLDRAVTNGHADLVDFLLRQRASVSHEAHDSWTVLHRGARRGDARIVTSLLRAGEEGFHLKGDRSSALPLHLAVRSADLTTVKTILDHEPNTRLTQLQHTDKKGSDAKAIAFFCTNYHIYKYLRQLEYDLLSAQPGQLQIFDPALPLTLAIERSDLKQVTRILSERPELLTTPSSTQQLPLHTAFLERDLAIAERLLRMGADISAVGYHGWTPLHIAATLGSVPLLDLVLSRSKDNKSIDATSHTKQTALHKACGSGSLLALQRLLQAGADPHARNDSGMTSLHIAAHRNFTDGVKELLSPQWGASGLVFCRDATHRTARDWASRSGHLAMANLLLAQEVKHKDTADAGKAVALADFDRIVRQDTASSGGSVGSHLEPAWPNVVLEENATEDKSVHLLLDLD